MRVVSQGSMRFLFQRVVQNEKSWTAPSGGRRGSEADSGYIVEHGFATEDWNFCLDEVQGGGVQGYMYYTPKHPQGEFNIVFAAYDKGVGWKITGFYDRAVFVEDGAVFSSNILKRRALELDALDATGSLGGEYRRKSTSKKATLLAKIAKFYRWRVRPENVVRLQIPVAVSHDVTKGFGAYYTRPTEITKLVWDQLRSLTSDYANVLPKDDYPDGGDAEFPEGAAKQIEHFVIERNKKLVIEAKAAFITNMGIYTARLVGLTSKQFSVALGAGSSKHIITDSQLATWLE